MKKGLFVLSFFIVSISHGVAVNLLEKSVSEVPVTKINQEVAGYLENEIGYKDAFKSDYVLAEFKESSSGKVWYVLDGYFTLKDQTILFMDFDYNPEQKTWKAINNYAFVPEENRRFLLKAHQVCNPYERHFLGVLMFAFKEPGHLDEMVSFLNKELSGAPMLYTDGSNHMIQDLTATMGAPLFTLREEDLVKKISALEFVKRAMIIPSGRNPSDDIISQRYEGVNTSCK
ncbi:hypothetical protein D3C87_259820 [compost metagenome]